jgi:hypothetical protein
MQILISSGHANNEADSSPPQNSGITAVNDLALDVIAQGTHFLSSLLTDKPCPALCGKKVQKENPNIMTI